MMMMIAVIVIYAVKETKSTDWIGCIHKKRNAEAKKDQSKFYFESHANIFRNMD